MYFCVLNIGNHELLGSYSGVDENSGSVECDAVWIAERLWLLGKIAASIITT
jgi:hypothetical protein